MRRRFARDAASLGAGAAVSGIAVYAFAAIGAHAVGAEAFAPVSVLWTFWAVTGAALTFPIQHWVIRRIHADGGEGGVRRALPRLAALVAGAGLATGAVGALLREDLFRRGDLLFPALLAAIPVGSAAMGLLRGALAARERFRGAALSFAGENLIRVALAVVAAAAGWGVEAYGAILVGGYAIALAWPSAFRFEPDGARAGAHQLGFLSGIAAASLLAQLVLTGAPVALALAGAHEVAITSTFAALALYRAPYVLATGVASRATAAVTSWALAGSASRLRLVQAGTVAGTAAAAGAFAATALVARPVLRALFGPSIALSRPVIAILAAGSAVALGTLAQGIVLIGRARWREMLGAWTAGLVTAVAWAAFGSGPAPTRVAVAFLAGEAVAFVVMAAGEARALREPAVVPDAPYA